MKVRRVNGQRVSLELGVEPYVTSSNEVQIHWGTGGNDRGAGWSVTLSPGDFKDMARSMIAADREAALDAFAAAIKGRRRKPVRRDYLRA